jgi:tetratricopeptide (TPR) repeat protein
VGTIFSDMGATRMASEYASRRLEALSAAGADRQEQARALIELATRMLLEDRLEDAGKHADRALELAGSDATLQVEAKVAKARVMVASYDFNGVSPLLQDIEAQLLRTGGQPAIALAWVQGLRARIIAKAMRRDEAKVMFDAAIAKALAIEGQKSPVAVALRIDAADAWAVSAFADQADAYFNPAIAALHARGGDHGVLAAIESARFAAKRYAAFGQISAQDALAVIAKSRTEIEMGGRVIPEEIRLRLETWEASVLLAWGNTEMAIPIAERSFPALLKITQSPRERTVLNGDYGYLLMYSGQHERADQSLREGLRLKFQLLGKTHPYAAGAYADVAVNMAMMSRYDEALAFLEAAPRFGAVNDEGTQNADRYNDFIRAAKSQVLVLAGKGKEALAAFAPNRIPKNPVGGSEGDDEVSLLEYGEVLCAAGQPVEGLRMFRSGLAMVEKDDYYYEFYPRWERVRAVAAQCALKAGERKQALIWARHLRAAANAQPHANAFFLAPLLKVEAALGIPDKMNVQGGLLLQK